MKNILVIILSFVSTISFGQQLIGTSDNLNQIPGNIKILGTAGTGISTGTTAQRSGAYLGQIRFNTDSNRLEIFNNSSAWQSLLYNGEGGASGAAVGNVVTNAQVKAIFYGGTGGVLRQDTAKIAWDSTNKRLGIGTSVPLNVVHVTSANSADGLSVDGSNNPAIVLRSNRSVKGYAPAIITSTDGFFLGTVAGDFAFRNESNKIHFGITGGNTPTLTIASATGVGIGNVSPNASAYLDITGTAKGFLMPRMTNTQRDAISSPAAALKVYSTTLNSENTYNGTNWTGAIAVSSAGTLTLIHGNDYVFTGTTTTWTLPAISASILGRQNAITIANRGSDVILLNSNSGSAIYNGAAVSTISIPPGTSARLIPDGTYFIYESSSLNQSLKVASNFTATSNTTLTNITGLSALVAAGKTYKYEVRLYTTSANTGGVKFAINGTATATTLIQDGYLFEQGNTINPGTTRATALGTTVCDHTSTTAAFATISGTIVVNAAGTLTVQFAQNNSDGTASTVLAGSTFIVTQLY